MLLPAAASRNDKDIIVVYSEGYDKPFEIDTSYLEPSAVEKGSPSALIRGIIARFKQLDFNIGGFSACVASEVLPGSGLSSSASFEVLIGTIINVLFNDGNIDPVMISKTGQYAENNYFGKPCGLMDQIACACGGIVRIDFQNPENPAVEKIDFDLKRHGYALIIIDTGGSHANLTEDYALIRTEMKNAAQLLGYEYARGISFDKLLANNRAIRKTAGDRAFLRLFHFIEENKRVDKQVDAL